MKKDFLNIDGVLISPDILNVRFFCDLGKCKGTCCIIESEFSAPLAEHEISEIEKIITIVSGFLPHDHVREINKKGFWEKNGKCYRTRSVNNRDCVFVSYDGDIAKCGIEKAYQERKIDFIKPLSCHLFPIRISDFSEPILRYEEYHECKPALQKGLEKNMSLINFCQDALERVFGKEWFKKMKRKTGS